MTTIYCECGEPLVEDLDVAQVKVEDEEITFRRGSDYIACDACGAMRSVRSLRAEAVADGELDPDEEPLPPTISGPLQEAADEALRAIQAMSGGAGDAWEGDYADVVLSALSDIHHEEDEDEVAGGGLPAAEVPPGDDVTEPSDLRGPVEQ